jgi:hypothetical protein
MHRNSAEGAQCKGSIWFVLSLSLWVLGLFQYSIHKHLSSVFVYNGLPFMFGSKGGLLGFKRLSLYIYLMHAKYYIMKNI